MLLFAASDERIGFPFFHARLVLKNSPSRLLTTAIGNLPPEWLEHYSQEKMGKSDPVAVYARKKSAPAYTRDLTGAWRAEESDKRLENDAADFGIMHGITLPLSSPYF